MKMKVVMLVLFAIMLTTLSISRPSLAQDDEVENMGCWVNITSCLRDNEVVLCCPVIQQQIDDERDCFCLMKETALQNATVADSFSTIFTFCDISGSFQTLCPDDSDSSSAPLASPDSSSPSSKSSSAPVEEPSPPSPTSTSSTPTTEVSTPSPDESLPADDGNCWSRMLNCTDSKSTDGELLECCPVLKQEISDERECFCIGAKEGILENPSDADAFYQYLTLCEIRDSFDTLCPNTNNSTSNGTGSRIPKKAKTLNISGSINNNIAHIVGLLPSSLLIIFSISFLI